MFIEYGVNEQSELIYIDQVSRGQTDLHCPYCGGLLLARKGQIKTHHFAHAGETCRQAERDQEVIALPMYDNFNLHLPRKAIDYLNHWYTNGHLTYTSEYEYLERYGLAQYNKFARKSRC